MSLSHLLRAFWALAKPYWFEDYKSEARRGLIAVLILQGSFSLMGGVMSYCNRYFMDALQQRDSSLFLQTVAAYLLTFLLSTPLSARLHFQRRSLSLNWRRWLMGNLIRRYFQNGAYMGLRKLDNIDERLEQDVNTFVHQSGESLVLAAFAFMDFSLYLVILCTISLPLAGFSIAYILLGLLILWRFGQTLIGLQAKNLKLEADLRSELFLIRSHAEKIALQQIETPCQGSIQRAFNSMWHNFHCLIGVERQLLYYKNAYNYFVLILPSAFLAPSYFSGQLSYGVLIQAQGAFTSVLLSSSLILNHYELFCSLGAVISRLKQVDDLLCQEQPPSRRPETHELVVNAPFFREREKTCIRVQPKERVLLIESDSSSLRLDTDLITTPPGTRILVNHPFFPSLPLEELAPLRLLQGVGLGNRHKEDANTLTLSEKQRLQVAHCLAAKPEFLLIHHAFSSLGTTWIERLFRLIQKFELGYLTVSLDDRLRPYHERCISPPPKEELSPRLSPNPQVGVPVLVPPSGTETVPVVPAGL